MEIRRYLTASGQDLFQTWLDDLKDMRARVAIQRRIDRLAAGNFATTSFVAMVFPSCGSTSVRVTGLITPGRDKPLC